MKANTYVSKMTIRGSGHKKKGLPNQDSIFYREISDKQNRDYTIMAVMDGVSSCMFADRASRFIAKNIMKVFRLVLTGLESEFTLDLMKNFIELLYKNYMEFIKSENGTVYEYATTAEIVVITDNKVYVLHAGDGLILFLRKNGEFVVLEKDKHSGVAPGEVYPFSVKDRWEFNEYEDVAGVFVASDGVYDEIVPAPARRSGYTCDVSLIVPMMDIRAHKSKKEMRAYQFRYIAAKLADEKVCDSCCEMIDRGMIKGIESKKLREHFLNNRPYKKFCHSSDDLSFVLWADKEKLPKIYEFNDIPNYFSIWLKERRSC